MNIDPNTGLPRAHDRADRDHGSPNMPALCGTTKMTGPLPFTAAVPVGAGPPLVIDAALGVANRGKLISA